MHNKCNKCSGLLIYHCDGGGWDERSGLHYLRCVNCANTIWLRIFFREWGVSHFVQYEAEALIDKKHYTKQWANMVLETRLLELA